MEFLEKVIFGLILITVVGLSFVLLIVFSDSGDSSTTTTKGSTSNTTTDSSTSSGTSTNTNSEASTGSSYGTDLHTRSTDYDTDNIDLENTFEEGELVYCLTNTNNCEKMDAITCDENHIETYVTEENCLSAKAKRSGDLEDTPLWCKTDYTNTCTKVDSHEDCPGKSYWEQQTCENAL